MDSWYEKSSTPKYSKPPVIENVLGVRFSPDATITLVDVAQLQSKWIHKYPVFSHRLVESPPPFPLQPGFAVPMVPPEVRFWAETTDGKGLVQSQSNQMILNWRKTHEEDTYPGFETQLSEFTSLWKHQLDWASESNLDAPVPFEVEVTYVNDLGDLDNQSIEALPLFGTPTNIFPGRNTGLGYRFEHILEVAEGHPFQGVLRVSMDTAARNTGKAYLVMTCSTLLLVSPSDDLNGAFEVAHALTTNAFANSITSDLSNKYGLQE